MSWLPFVGVVVVASVAFVVVSVVAEQIHGVCV